MDGSAAGVGVRQAGLDVPGREASDRQDDDGTVEDQGYVRAELRAGRRVAWTRGRQGRRQILSMAVALKDAPRGPATVSLPLARGESESGGLEYSHALAACGPATSWGSRRARQEKLDACPSAASAGSHELREAQRLLRGLSCARHCHACARSLRRAYL